MSKKPPYPFRRNLPPGAVNLGSVPIIGQGATTPETPEQQRKRWLGALPPEYRKIPKPMMGLCVVRLYDVDKIGDIVMPTTRAGNGDEVALCRRVEVVATSGRFLTPMGAIVEHDAKPGDFVICGPGIQEAMNWQMPSDIRVIELQAIWAVLPPDEGEKAAVA